MTHKLTAKSILQAALSSAFAVSAALTPSAAFAVTSDTSLVNTGDDAQVNTTSNTNTAVTSVSNNTLNATQIMESYADTGNNSASGNIGGGSSIRTGNVVTSAEMAVQGNHNATAISGIGASGGGINLLDIVNSGDDANISSQHNNNTSVAVSNSNSADVNQALNSIAITGGNTSDGNINTGAGGGAGIVTGGILTNGEFDVDVNKNHTAISLLGGNAALLGSETVLTNTGDDATVQTSNNSNTTIGVSNTNNANIAQLMNAYSETGGNTSEDNIGGSGGIATGGISTLADFWANANHNTTAIGGGQNGGASLNVADLVNTGDDLNSSSVMNNNHTASAVNYNSLTEYSLFTHTSTTSFNSVDDNIGGNGGIWSGNTGAAGSFATSGNHNASAFGGFSDALTLWLLGSM